MNKYINFVLPKAYLIGYTSINIEGLQEYLQDTNQYEFWDDIDVAKSDNLSDGEILCSFYAKLCYDSLTLKKNKNITAIRSIEDNLKGTIDSQHGSVFEHCNINFVIDNCSRIMTHEAIRHRSGVAVSEKSGRYVRTDVLNIVVDPILINKYKSIERARLYLERFYNKLVKELKLDSERKFSNKKKITSALRRILPNGIATSIGLSINIRALRHIIQLRTHESAEWEIRYVFNQVFELVRDKYSIMFHDAVIEEIDGQNRISFENKKI